MIHNQNSDVVMLTRQQVIEARRTPSGCCSRYADNMGCDCFERAEPDAAPCLTSADVDEIERKVDNLYKLYNRCSNKGLSWDTDHKEVDDLMRHIDDNFPGYYTLQLVAEVRFLQRQVVELTRRLGENDTRDFPVRCGP